MNNSNIKHRIKEKYSWDSAIRVPLKGIDPNGSTPVVACSVLNNLDGQKHLKIGEALQTLRNQDILIIGSGASFHNFQYFFTKDEVL